MITRIFSLGWRVKDPCVPSHDYPPPRKVRAGITVFFLFEDARLCLSCAITLLGMSIESNWQFLQLSSRNFFLFLATSRRRACFLVRIHRAIALKGAIPPSEWVRVRRALVMSESWPHMCGVGAFFAQLKRDCTPAGQGNSWWWSLLSFSQGCPGLTVLSWLITLAFLHPHSILPPGFQWQSMRDS